MILKTLAIAILAFASCTFFEIRVFQAEPEPALESEQVASTFAAFRTYLWLAGYDSWGEEDLADPNSATFRINAPSSDWEMALRHDHTDLIELEYSGGTHFLVRLIRFHHGGLGLSEELVEGFVVETERLIRESTGRDVKLHLIADDWDE